MNFLKIILFFGLLIFSIYNSFAQCTALGQNPATAFPVCGDKIFNQQNVPICDNGALVVPGCNNGTNYTAKNPFWYKFTCYQSGTLSFTITPNTLNDDYDWQLYDVTGLDVNQVYTDANIIVTGNWSGSGGTTGASSSGVNFIQCSSVPTDNKPRFAKSPNIIAGHNYLLLVSHFDDSQDSYSLSFGGGTASITDPLDPRLKYASAPCDGTEIRVKVNKKMKCTSLAADGSDFIVETAAGTIITAISAIADNCTSSFDFDSLSVFLPSNLAPGTYKLKAKKGSDGNTILDNCDREIPVNDSVFFTVYPLFPTPMDSLTTPKCAPDSLVLVFKKNIKCSSIEPSGSDFFITGPYAVNIVSATGNCIRGGSNTIVLKLSAPLQVHGNFLVNLKTGTDGNTLIDECDKETPLPDDVAFVIKDTVNANFNFSVNYSCTQDVVSYTHNGANQVNSWNWATAGGLPANSTLQNPVITYTNFEPKQVQLIVSNSVCADTSTQQIIFDNYLKADFEVSPIICPDKPAVFVNKTIGNITDWKWTMGNGNIITVQNPLPQTYIPLSASDYNALPTLLVKNNYGCFDEISKPITVVYSCFIAVPSAFTPNGDGVNDFLYPLKAYKSTNLSFNVYNRFGQLLFHGDDWQQKWNGKFKSELQPPGTYVWMLDYTNTETGAAIHQKGTTILIR